MRKKGFTLIELLVVIAIIAMLLAILMPALSKVKKIAMRVVCATNLKGLGTAQTVYANDYDDEYVVQGAGNSNLTWSDGTSAWQDNTVSWATRTEITVGASLYLLVREADVSPKSFICPSGDQQEFSGKNISNLDIVELYDFGKGTTGGGADEGPINCVSYSYHQPYKGGTGSGSGAKGPRAADGTRSAAFAVMADKNPYFETKLTNSGTVTQANYKDNARPIGADAVPSEGAYEAVEKWRVEIQNALPHDREGQNILFGDGHTSYENRADVAVKNDCIYSMWDSSGGATELSRRRGVKITARAATIPQGNDDSVLINDDTDFN